MKYYYTDPLAAAYMEQAFYVDLCDKRNNPVGFGIYQNSMECYTSPESEQYSGLLCIDPDSYHIFEPQVGDLVQRKPPHEIYQGDDDLFIFINDERMLKINTEGDKNNIIIQRNNKPFFWPKVQND